MHKNPQDAERTVNKTSKAFIIKLSFNSDSMEKIVCVLGIKAQADHPIFMKV